MFDDLFETFNSIRTPTVFLGGTANNTTWRDKVISGLKINYYNPIVPNWTEAHRKIEIEKRKECDFVLYVISPAMSGVYSIAETVDDSNKQPHKTVFCFLKEDTVDGKHYSFTESQIKSLKAVGKMVKTNGGTWCDDLGTVVEYLNSTISK